MKFPLKNFIELESIPVPNRFGAKRKFDVHTGLDLFAPEGEQVYACEDGVVIDVSAFTGASINMPWWNDTDSVSVKGVSGVILYGEVTPLVKEGDTVREGDLIATVKRVLLKDKGKPMSMLHIEWYAPEKAEDDIIWVEWCLDDLKPPHLRNIEELLYPL